VGKYNEKISMLILCKVELINWAHFLLSLLSFLYEFIKQWEWTVESFRFYTAVSVMASLRIEGETMEIDNYLKHKLQDIENLPKPTEKPNDLFEAYEYARDNALTLSNF